MNFRAYLWTMTLITIVAWGGWAYVLWSVNPAEAGWLGLILFYITLFAALIGTFAVSGSLYRVLILKHKEVISREVRITFRHAVMVSLIGIVCLALSAKEMLHYWVLLGLVTAAGVIEYVFLLMQESRRS